MAKIKKIAIYAVIIIVLLLAGLLAFDIKNDAEEATEFSSYNMTKEGGKALYLLADRMGFDVDRYKRPARFIADRVTMVAFAPDYEIFNDNLEQKYLLRWIKRGNVLVLIDIETKIDDGTFRLLQFADKSSAFGDYGQNYIYNMGKGKVIFLGNYEGYTNEGLKALDPGVVFIDALNEASFKKVLFNEYFHGIGSPDVSLWDILNPGFRLALIQISIAALIFIYIVSRRFGKPLVVYEIVKRKENENLFALSNIYQKAKANNLVLELYLNNLKKDLARFLGFGKDTWDDTELLNAAEANKLLEKTDLKEVIAECNYYIKNGMKDQKKLLDLFKRLERIRKEIKI